MAENKEHPGWGGRRKNQTGRPRTSPEGVTRKMRSTRASDSEWEVIKRFAKCLKDNPERAEQLVSELEALKEN